MNHTILEASSSICQGSPSCNSYHKLCNNRPEFSLFHLQIISKFRDDELTHHDIGLDHEAEQVIWPFAF